MAQQLGIKVKVNLPSKSQLEEEFRKTWGDFKAEFSAKVNVSADKNSLNKMKTQIKKVLDGYNVTIKPRVDVTSGAKDLRQLLDGFLKLRDVMEKTIHVNIDSNKMGKDLGNSFVEKTKQQSKAVAEAGKQTAQTMKQTTEREMQSIDGSLEKLVAKTRQTANGIKRTLQETTKDNEFVTRTTSQGDGNSSTQVVYNQKAALNQLKTVMKEIAALETKIAGSSNVGKNNAYSQRIEYLKTELKELVTTYKNTFDQINGGSNSFDRMQSEVNSIRNLNVALAETGRKAKEASSAIKEITRIENSKFKLSMNAMGAGDNEKSAIGQQIALLNEREQKIKASANAENLLTSKEKEQLSIIRAENSLRLATAQAKAQDKAAAQVELETYRKLKSDLTVINRLEKEKANLEGKRSVDTNNAGYESRLKQVQSEISARKSLYEWEKKNASEAGKIGSKSSQNLSAIEREASAQANLNHQIGAAAAKVEQSSHYYNELSSSIARSAKLQAEMASSGSRETNVIRQQIAEEQKFQSEIRQTISNLNLENAALEKQVAAQKSAAATSTHYSRSRATAKEQDTQRGISAMIDPFNALQQTAFGVAAAVGSLEKLDTAMVRVTKVVNAPKKEMDEFTGSIYKNASAVGKSADEYASAVEQWATAGYNLKQSTKLAKDSVMGSFVGDIDVNDMVKYMAVPLNAFKKQMLSSKDVINAMNEVSNDNAIEMDDLGQAYSKAASTVSTTGTSFAQLTGLVTAAQEGTRAGGDVIGRAIKSISINLNNLGTGITAVNKSRQESMEKMGIHFRDQKGNLKSTYQILGNIHKVWGSLSKDQKSQVAYYVAGKEQAAQFEAIIKNWNVAVKATGEAQKQVSLKDPTKGSAFKEFEKEQNSVQFHMVKLKNTWSEFLNTLVGGREGMNNMIDGVEKLLKSLEGFAKNKDLLNSVKFVAVLAGVALVHAAFNKMEATIKAVAVSEKNSLRGVTDGLIKVADQAAVTSMALKGIDANGMTGFGNSKLTTKTKKPKVTSSEMLSVASASGSLPKISTAAEATTGKMSGLLRTVVGVGKGLLGLVPIIGDVIMVWQVLDALGINPFKGMFNDAVDTTKALKDLNKELENIQSKYETAEKALSKNTVFNGKAKAYEDQADGLGKTLANASKNGQTSLDADQFTSFKQTFDSIAKKNNLPLRITLNNYDSLKEQLDALNAALDEIERKNAKKGVKNINTETSGLKKLESTKTTDKLFGSNKDFVSKAQEIKDNIDSVNRAIASGGTSYNAGQKRINEYKQQLVALSASYQSGAKNAKLWSSEAGKAIESQWDTQSKSVRTHINQLKNALNDNVFSKEELQTTDKKTAKTMGVAQGSSLEELGQKQKMIDTINQKLKTGGTLNNKELEYLGKQNSSLLTKTTNTSKWSSAEKQAAQEASDAYQKSINKDKGAQEDRMRTILTAANVAKKSQDGIIKKYEEGGAAYIRLMSRQGELGKSMLNISAQFAQQYGANWGKAYAQIQKDVDSVPKSVETQYSLVDKTTGLVNTKIITQLNSIPKSKVTKYGFKYNKDGKIDMKSVATALKELPQFKNTKYDVDGTVDAQKLINDLINDTNAVPKDMRLQITANAAGFNSTFKETLLQYESINGKTQTLKFLGDNKYFGLSKDQVLAWLKQVDGTTGTAKIKAKTADAKQGIEDVNKSVKGVKDKKLTLTGDVKDAAQKLISAQKKLDGIKDKTTKLKGNKKDVDKKVTDAQTKIDKLKGKQVTIKSKTTGKKEVTTLGSEIKKIKNNNTKKTTAKTEGANKVKTLGGLIRAIKNNNPKKVAAHVQGKADVKSLHKEIDKISRKNPKSVKASVSGIKSVDHLASSIKNIPTSKSVTISVSKTETTTKITRHKKAKSVAISPESITSTNPTKALSVAIGDNAQGVSRLANNNLSVKDLSDSTENNNTISEDVWRYWGQQLYTGDSLSSQVTRLENLVTKAKEDMDSLIKLARQRIDLDNRQIAYQNSLKNSYQSQLNSVMSQLHGYGFKTNGNQVTNFDHAKSFKGDQADKVSTLLDTYKSVYENIVEVGNQIESLNLDKWQQQENITGYETTKAINAIEKLTKEVDSLTTVLSNNASILSVGLSSLGNSDYAMKIKLSKQSISDQMSSIQQLINEFNKLSIMNFNSTDDAEKIQTSLTNIKSSILSDADAINTLRQSINDAQIAQIAEDLTNFTTTLNSNIDSLKTNVTDLEDGLLNGQKFSDLESSSLDVIDFDQASGLSSAIKARMNLEQELDSALDNFAKKDVDRTAQVANQQLQIQQNKYSQLLGLAQSYSDGTLGNISLNSNLSSALKLDDVVGSTNSDLEQNFVQISQGFATKLDKLKEKYQQSINGSGSQAEKDAATQQFIVEQLKLQEDIYNGMIDADRKSISALKEKLKLQGLTTDQITTIKNDIASYESSITTAQTNIKAAIKERFDYENTLMQNQITKYKTMTTTITNMVTLAKTLGLSTDAQGKLMEQEYASTFVEYGNYLKQLSRLRGQQSQYSEGSYEYKQLQTQIDDLLTNVQTTVSSLIDINKSQFQNSLSGIQKDIEKMIYGGKSADQYKLDNEVYYQGVNKELELESLRLKANDLESNVVKDRMSALDKQEKMSKIEADYLDKEIDLQAAKEKLENVSKKKDVQVLEKDANGKFNWTYEANQTDVESAEKEYNSAAQAAQTYKEQQKDDYLSKVEAIISGIQDGSITPDDAKNRLSEINDAYGSLLQDIPTFNPNKLNDIIAQYNNYIASNKDVLDNFGNSSDIAGNGSYQELLQGFSEQFKSISADLGTIFGKQLRAILQLPDVTSGSTVNNVNSTKSIAIQSMSLELPDVSDAESFVEALKTLPEIAVQSATKK